MLALRRVYGGVLAQGLGAFGGRLERDVRADVEFGVSYDAVEGHSVRWLGGFGLVVVVVAGVMVEEGNLGFHVVR